MKLAIIGSNGLDEVANENSLPIKLKAKYKSKGSKVEKTFTAYDVNLSNGHILYINRDVVGMYEGKSYFYPSEIDYKTIFVALKQAGIKNVLSLSPAGSLEESWKPSSAVLVRDFVDFVNRDITLDDIGADYVDMLEPFNNDLSNKILEEAKKMSFQIFDKGIYLMGINGVRFETNSEINLFKRISKESTLVGMITPTEAQLCRLLDINYSNISFVVNSFFSQKKVKQKDAEDSIKKNLPKILKLANSILPSL